MTESKYDWHRPAPIPADHSIRLRAEIHALKNELAQAYDENRKLRAETEQVRCDIDLRFQEEMRRRAHDSVEFDDGFQGPTPGEAA